MSIVLNSITSVPAGEHYGLRVAISTLESRLKATNEKLGHLRNITRKQCTTKSRNVYLSKIYTMVKQQHTLKSNLDKYKVKLKDLQMPNPQKTGENLPTKNEKLFDLLHNVEPLETPIEIMPLIVNKPAVSINSIDEENKTQELKIVSVESIEPVKVPARTHGEAMQCLKAHVNKRKIVVEKKPTSARKQYNNMKVKYSIGHIIDLEKTVNVKQKLPKKMRVDKPIGVNNLSDAIQYLEALQEYAMLNDNYRAIGLLADTEKAFKNPPVVDDFEE